MKVTITLLCFFVWFFISSCLAQVVSFPGDARSLGMSNTQSMLGGHWSCFSNPAGISDLQKSTFGLVYFNRFGVIELSGGAFSLGIPSRSGNFAAGVMTSGYAAFKQSRVCLAYARSLGKYLRAGIGIHWLQINQPAGYPDMFAVVPSIGLLCLPAKNLIAGFSVFNPARQGYQPGGYMEVPAGFIAGAGYHFGDELLLCIEAEKLHKTLTCRAGIEVSIEKILFLRMGVSINKIPGYSFGIGMIHRRISINAAAEHHPVLGFNPVIGLSYTI